MDEFVRKSLINCKCERFIQIFEGHEIDEDDFLTLKIDELQRILPGKVGPQKKILQYIEKVLESRSQHLQKDSPDNNVQTTEEPSNSLLAFRRERAWSISIEDMIIHDDKMLGSGNFGAVYLGTLKTSKRKVAVKFITFEADSDLQVIKSEVKTMKNIGRHRNLVELIGTCMEMSKKRCVIVTEYCNIGDMRHYLLRRRDEFVDDLKIGRRPSFIKKFGEFFGNRGRRQPTASVIIHNYTLRSSQLLRWALQISDGMEYLSRKQIVHADLAARNILLSNTEVAKVGDFGLSKCLYEKSYYRKESNCKQPWAWTAIECLKEYKFSSWSDIWSYGVTLWELFSLADQPFKGCAWTPAFVADLEKGMRLLKPKHFPIAVYDLMKICWDAIPQNRIPFREISRQLSEMISAFQEASKSSATEPTKATPGGSRNTWVNSGLSSKLSPKLLEEIELYLVRSKIPQISTDYVQLDTDYDHCLKERYNWGTSLKAYKGTFIVSAPHVDCAYSNIKPIPDHEVTAYVEEVTAYREDGTFCTGSIIRCYINKLVTYAHLSYAEGGVGTITNTNVVKLLCADFSEVRGGNLCISTEYCMHGQLSGQLEQMRSIMLTTSPTTPNRSTFRRKSVSQDVCVQRLHKWTNEVANGMEFLSKNKVILGYITTKGVGISEGYTAKLFITPHTQQIMDSSNACGKLKLKTCSSFPLPWKCMATESFRKHEMSTKSDVWSYGVFLWTVMDAGNELGLNLESPNEHRCEQEEVPRIISNTRPVWATGEVHEIIKSCVRKNPDDRPSFNDIVMALRPSTNGREQVCTNNEPVYVNDEPAGCFFSEAPTAGELANVNAVGESRTSRYISQEEMIRYQLNWTTP